MRGRGLIPLIGISLAVVILGGCAADGSHAPDARAGRTVLQGVDTSYSTTDTRTAYLRDMTAVMRDAAQARARFWATFLDGRPTSTAFWDVEYDFSEVPSAYEGSSRLSEAYLARRASNVAARLPGLVEHRSRTPGSPLGESLLVFSRQCAAAGGRCDVYWFTDGVFQDRDRALDVRKPIAPAMERTYIRRWSRRLTGLRGARVHILGVGYGSSLSGGQLRRGEKLTSALLEASGAHLVVWNTRYVGDRGS